MTNYLSILMDKGSDLANYNTRYRYFLPDAAAGFIPNPQATAVVALPNMLSQSEEAQNLLTSNHWFYNMLTKAISDFLMAKDQTSEDDTLRIVQALESGNVRFTPSPVDYFKRYEFIYKFNEKYRTRSLAEAQTTTDFQMNFKALYESLEAKPEGWWAKLKNSVHGWFTEVETSISTKISELTGRDNEGESVELTEYITKLHAEIATTFGSECVPDLLVAAKTAIETINN